MKMRKKTILLLVIVGLLVGIVIIPTVALAAGSDTLTATASQSTAPATRAEFAQLAVSGLSLPTLDPATPTFSDVGQDNTYYQYVEGAAAAGLIRGLGGDIFGPDLQIGREQVATILARYLSSVELDTLGYISGTDGTHYPSLNDWYNAEGEAQLARYSDGASILAVHRPGVAYLTMRGIAEGSAGWFSPFSSVTEAQCVALVQRTAAVAASFTPEIATPVVTSISPANGTFAGGTIVHIYGANFTADSTVSFGSSAAASVTVNSSTLITAVSPAGTAGSTVQVSVVTGTGTTPETSAAAFTYLSADLSPTITYISPSSGWQGDTVTIIGTNFDYNSVEVYFGNVQATGVTYVNSTELLAVAPAGVDGSTVRVMVVTDYGTSPNTSADDFTYNYPYGMPSVSYVSPNIGWQGDTVTIVGSNFDYTGLQVYFGNVQAAGVTYVNSTELLAVAPAGVDGSTVRVMVVTDHGTSPNTYADDFTYNYPYAMPSVSYINPDNGWQGDTVAIYGANFNYSGLQVYFGGVPATSVSYVNSTELLAVVPAGVDGNTVQVMVMTDSGTSPNTSADDFTYQYPYGILPNVSYISPNNGPSTGSTTVYIHGANFTADSVVYFGVVAALSVTVNSDTLITAVSPAGTAGSTVPVSVTNYIGTSSETSADDFTYYAVSARPTISSISPNRGWEGDTVTITGTGFDGANLAVYFGSVPATSVTYVSPNELIVVVPAGTNGTTVLVSVATDDGVSANSRANRFLYWNGSGPGFPFYPHWGF